MQVRLCKIEKYMPVMKELHDAGTLSVIEVASKLKLKNRYKPSAHKSLINYLAYYCSTDLTALNTLAKNIDIDSFKDVMISLENIQKYGILEHACKKLSYSQMCEQYTKETIDYMVKWIPHASSIQLERDGYSRELYKSIRYNLGIEKVVRKDRICYTCKTNHIGVRKDKSNICTKCHNIRTLEGHNIKQNLIGSDLDELSNVHVTPEKVEFTEVENPIIAGARNVLKRVKKYLATS